MNPFPFHMSSEYYPVNVEDLFAKVICTARLITLEDGSYRIVELNKHEVCSLAFSPALSCIKYCYQYISDMSCRFVKR